MATKPKSIIEEALLEAKSLEDALKANTKEMLATHMKQEIENIVESSLKEQDEVIDDIEIGSDEEEEPAGEEIADLEIDVEAGDDLSADVDELELDLDLDADLEGAEEEEGEVELDIVDLPIDLDLGDDSELDLTGASDDEVLAVFKKMGDDDEVEVIKDEGGIQLTDNETGAEYYIKESEDLNEDGLCEGCGDDVSEDEEIVYEIELEEGGDFKGDQAATRSDYKGYKGTDKGYHGKTGSSHGDQGEPDDYLDEGDDWGSNKDEYKRTSIGGVKTRSGDVGGGKYGKGGHYKDYELDEHDDWGSDKDEYARRSSGGVKHRAGDVGGGKYGKGGHYKDYELDEGGDLEGDQSKTRSDYANYKGTDKGYHGKTGSSHGDQGEPDDYLEEDKLQRHQKNGYQRRSGAKVGSDQASPYGGTNESRKSRGSISERRKPKNVRKVTESKIVKEYNELKSKNEEYKGALKVFKNKLNEVALFNTNLAYVNRLFTEHSTTKGEKMNILKRFDGAESIKESKGIYKTIKGELETKTPITESVENKVNRTVKSSKSDLNESTAYVDPQIKAIKDLMKKIS